MKNFEQILLNQHLPAEEALRRLDRTGNRFLLITDTAGRLVGVLTDGDVRRGLLRGYKLTAQTSEFMQREYIALPMEVGDPEISRTLSERISFIPLLDEGGRPVDYASHQRHRSFPVAQPLLGGKEEVYVNECLQTGWISSQGRFVSEFERMIGEFHGVENVLAVSNGTVALQLALTALHIGPGDEVILPAVTFAATASAVIHTGAVPVFADVDPVTWQMGAANIEPLINSRTRAILPVHLYGFPCALTEISKVATRYGLVIVEDAAEALGAVVDGKLVGTVGDAATLSFFGNKTVTTGEGGAIIFKDSAVASRAKMLRDHGMDPSRRYWHLEPGFNFRLTNLQAAVGVAQMERVDKILARKRSIFERYEEEFAEVPEIVRQAPVNGGIPSCWLYTFLLAEDAVIGRDEVAERLLQNGIETRPMFYPLPDMPAFMKFAAGRVFPGASSIASRGLSLPSSVVLTDDDLATICKVVKSIVNVRRLIVSNSV